MEAELSSLLDKFEEVRGTQERTEAELAEARRELRQYQHKEDTEGVALKSENDVLRADLTSATELAEKQNELAKNLGQKSELLQRENRRLEQAVQELKDELDEYEQTLRHSVEDAVSQLRESQLSHLVSSSSALTLSDAMQDVLALNASLLKRLCHHAVRIASRINHFTPRKERSKQPSTNGNLSRHSTPSRSALKSSSRSASRSRGVERRGGGEEEEDPEAVGESSSRPLSSSSFLHSDHQDTHRSIRRSSRRDRHRAHQEGGQGFEEPQPRRSRRPASTSKPSRSSEHDDEEEGEEGNFDFDRPERRGRSSSQPRSASRASRREGLGLEEGGRGRTPQRRASHTPERTKDKLQERIRVAMETYESLR
jgi:uncharacterized protein YoxC